MKKNWLILVLAGLLSLSAQAQQVERVYVSTDRNAYLSGERVWCSLFCVDENGKPFNGSSIAYLELISPDGTALEVKSCLMNGRGAVSFLLPSQLPTGPYRLLAYTPTGSVSYAGSRLLSIYNPFSTARVQQGVTMSESAPALEVAPQKDANLSLQVPRVLGAGKNGLLLLDSSKPVSLSVSIYHEDALQQFPCASITSFAESKETVAKGTIAPEGEIIRGKVYGANEKDVTILSSCGNASDIYTGKVEKDGSIAFITGNIYGNRELVYEVLDGTDDSFIQLESPFLHPSGGDFSELVLSESLFSNLVTRKDHLRYQAKADTLYQFLPRREDLLFAGSTWDIYNLDDYTRFPTVREVLVEILPSVRLSSYQNKPSLQVLINDGVNRRKVFLNQVLVLMDGVVITDLNLILTFDAMLLDRVEVFRHSFVIGHTPYNGAVHFISQKNYVTALNFPRRVRVMDFEGVGYPVACTKAPQIPEGEKDLRELLYWHPILEVKKQTRVNFTAPSYQGTFKVVAEGMDADGNPVRCVESFEVR